MQSITPWCAALLQPSFDELLHLFAFYISEHYDACRGGKYTPNVCTLDESRQGIVKPLELPWC